MLEHLIHIDQKLFLFINSHHNPFFDWLMYIISAKVTWIPLYLAILVWLGIKYRGKFWLMLLFIAIAATLADQVSVQLFKNVFHRLRPCHEPSLENMVHLVRDVCGGLYGFVSSHASNSFNVAILSSLLIRKRWFTISMLIWAAVICCSRVYLGVHYPGDVICGAIVGSLIGWAVYKIYILSDNALSGNRLG